MPTRPDYAKHKARARARSAAMSSAGRDIGNIPPVAEPKRLAEAERSFRRFCEHYFPNTFTKPWSDDHLAVMGRIETVVNHDRRLAVAMPRGQGKTSLCEKGTLWALLTGKHPFVFLIGAAESHADQMLKNLKAELAHNDLLAADFPAICYPIRSLEGETRRCKGQTHHGRPTMIEWSESGVVLPTIPGSPASGGIVRTAGITGNIRGAVHIRPDGRSLRPTLAIVDDPQTEESAASPQQCQTRLATINGAIAGLAGPGRATGIIIPCTVIEPGDLADRLLDREQSPEWGGERMKLVYSFPTNQKRWDEYAELRRRSLAAGGEGEEATEFYRRHRRAMDAGARVAWEHRHNRDELSALQHAMNLRISDEAAFWAEYQNEPQVDHDETVAVTVEQVLASSNGREPGKVSPATTWLTGFIDVQERMLYWAVAAWSADFTGSIIAYGTWPDQKRGYFTYRDAKRTLRRHYQGLNPNAAIRQGLDDLAGQLLAREWSIDADRALRIDRLLIDAGYKPELVGNVARKLGPTVLPAKGVGIKAGHRPMAAYRKKRGERHGHHWYIPQISKTAESRHVLVDTNHWKTHVHRAIAAGDGEPGALTLYGSDPERHRMLAEHVAASETCEKTEGHGRVVYEWSLKPAKPDNHLFDVIVGTAVAASMLGARVGDEPARRPKKRLKLSSIQRGKS